MTVGTGTYTIENVTHRSIAAQSPDIEAVVADVDKDRTQSYGHNLRMLWTISHLNGDKYTIKNMGTNDYAACTIQPGIDDIIVNRRTRYPWTIKETGFKGKYVIYTTAASNELFWGLPNDELSTPISLRDKPNHPSNQWVLTKVPSLGELEEETNQWRRKFAELREENTKLRESIDISKADAERERERHEQAELQLTAKLRGLQEGNTKLRDSIDQLKADARERERLERAEAQLQTKLAGLVMENTKLRASVDLLKADAVKPPEDAQREIERDEQAPEPYGNILSIANGEDKRYGAVTSVFVGGFQPSVPPPPWDAPRGFPRSRMHFVEADAGRGMPERSATNGEGIRSPESYPNNFFTSPPFYYPPRSFTRSPTL
ncbi:hypothetical protein BD410DRAFT_840759 [Rickenella mellea]|uniref:Uncharacterized protein n=1 Tax=Rickenella mellea TaxID=50990 RepID=A0A4Y7Q056_9AGAM|nr:hypothetical protein BD410DRAFT_840759 [Rickenella mellea]